MPWRDDSTEEWHDEEQPPDHLDRVLAADRIIDDLEKHHLIHQKTGMVHSSITLLFDGKIVMTPSADIHYSDLQEKLIREFSADTLRDIGIAGYTVDHTEISQMGHECCLIDHWLEHADGLFTLQQRRLCAYSNFSIIQNGKVILTIKKGTPKLDLVEHLYRMMHFQMNITTDIIRDHTENALAFDATLKVE